MARRLFTLLVIAFTGFALAAPESLAQSRSSWFQFQQQQQQPQRGGFFQRLFGLGQPNYPPPSNPFGGNSKPTYKAPKKKKAAAAPADTQPPVVTADIAPKDSKARKVMVIGDLVADGLAWGLDQAFATEPRIQILDDSQANSGLVRTDQYDWNTSLLTLLNKEKPDIVVAVFGANDRQQMKTGAARMAVRSPGWEKAYTAHIDGLTETLKVYGRPFFWMSAPPIRTADASQDMAYLNSLYKPRVEGAGGTFIDIWNGFTNADGQYIMSGPDMDGQVRQLRTSDGVNFTKAGKLKLSFYLEKEIRRKTGIGAGSVELLASTTEANQIEIGPDGKKRLVGPIISLSDPLPGASDDLAGAPAAPSYDPILGAAKPTPVAATPATQEDSLRYDLVVKGDPLPAVIGRADDFAWPSGSAPRAAAAAAIPAPPPAQPPAPSADASTPGLDAMSPALGVAPQTGNGPAPISKSN